MPWRLGIDEAGYGPNLGPLVMTALACRVPDDLPDPDPWRLLGEHVCRGSDVRNGRLLVDDSKVVYGSGRGLDALECSVLSFVDLATGILSDADDPTPATLLAKLAPQSLDELGREVWFTGTTVLPVTACPATIRDWSGKLRDNTHRRGLSWGPLRSALYCPARFNDVVDATGSKGAVLAHGFAELVRGFLESRCDDEAIHVVVDKHGGRNCYSAIVQHAVGEAMVVARSEALAGSHYEVVGAPVSFSFLPRADGNEFGVALASMVSKYLREILMLEFNRFWQTHVPGLKATAGYPVDARRFFDAIAPARQQLKLADRVLWRQC